MRQRPLPYGFAGLAVALAVSVLFIPGLGQGLAGLLFFAVLVSAWYGGAKPGLGATAAIVVAILGIYAYHGKFLPAWQIWSLAIFAALGILIALIIESLHVARREVERREQWFSTALRSIGDAVIATDGQGRVTFMNPVAEALTGWIEQEARGRPLSTVFNIISERTRQPVENPVDKVLENGVIVGLANHTLLVARDGRELPIDDSAAPIADVGGEISGVILVFRDITEIHRAAELKERLAAIVESSDDVIVSKTLDGIITSWNGGAERTLGYTAAEVVGQHVSLLIPPDHAEDVEKILGQVRRGERVDHYETRRVRKDGTIIDVSVSVSPIRNPEGIIIGAAKVGRDITQRKRIEAERREADRRKDEFLAMLAHELRNPLASINNAARLLDNTTAEDELEWAKDVILRHVKHLARLIDDLLDVSRIDRGKIGLRKEQLEVAPIVRCAVESVGPIVAERGHRLDVSIHSDGLRVEADPVRLEQILVNLLTNAAKYTDFGGHIRLDVDRDGDEIVFKVRDNGMGIAPDLLPGMFDLFTQGDRSSARSEGGLGIGLTLVKRLAEMHGGSVTGASEGPGRGSEFVVRLPALCDQTDAEVAAVQPSRPRVARPGSRLLIVDDNIDTARGLARLLRMLGHEVRVAHDGPEAIEAARVHRPEIVLLDIGLPGMDGYQVARRLRADGGCEDSIIIAVSGYGQDEDRRRSREAGFNHHLVKPLDYDTLTSLIAEPR